MINKTYKNIHNKYSALFKFIFFLRHLVGIFFISAALFLFIPHIIDFKEKDEILKKSFIPTNFNELSYDDFIISRTELLEQEAKRIMGVL